MALFTSGKWKLVCDFFHYHLILKSFRLFDFRQEISMGMSMSNPQLLIQTYRTNFGISLKRVHFFFITHNNKETTTLYFAPYTAGKDTESSGPNCIWC